MPLTLDPALLLGVGVIAVLAFLVLGFFVAPRRYVRKLPDLGPPPVGDRIPLKDQVTIHADQEKRRNDLRTGALQAIGGLALIFALLTTLLQLQANQRQATDQQDLTRRGQIADRFTKAIDQLGNQNNLDVRLGGIYALEQIARDSPDDRTRLATYEVLTAYVREHAIWKPDTSIGPESLSRRAPDIQAVMTVLARRKVSKGDPAIYIEEADLRNAFLDDAHLEDAYLDGAHLEGTFLWRAHLERANLGDTHLERAFLDGAHLERADLIGIHLEHSHVTKAHLEQAYLKYALLGEADFQFSHLEGATLDDAHLEGAGLLDAYLGGASLKGAHLEGANLRHTDLKGAQASGNTTWPTGFDWQAAGVKMAS